MIAFTASRFVAIHGTKIEGFPVQELRENALDVADIVFGTGVLQSAV